METKPASPYWVKMFLALEKQGGTGLSVPFLVGAATIMDENHYPSIEDARSLLEEIFEKGIDTKIIKIFWCSFTKAYVLGITKQESRDGKYLLSPAAIYAIDLVCDEFGSSVEEIRDGLTALYAEEITKKTYSITNGNWHVYDERDKNFILKAFQL